MARLRSVLRSLRIWSVVVVLLKAPRKVGHLSAQTIELILQVFWGGFRGFGGGGLRLFDALGFLLHLLPKQFQFLLQLLRRVLRHHAELSSCIHGAATKTGSQTIQRGLHQSFRGAHRQTGGGAPTVAEDDGGCGSGCGQGGRSSSGSIRGS